MGRRPPILAFLCLGLAALVLSAPARSRPQAWGHTQARDPFVVYFRHDAVGRNMLSLVATTCGTERWPVKTATDDDRRRIHRSAVATTIKYLDSRSEPSDRPQTSRVKPVEVTTYRLTARLVEYKREDDSDYHLVLRDGRGRTMIAEIPAPGCVGRISSERDGILAARRWFDRHYSPGSDFTFSGQRVTITGIGFFDYLHGQTGVAPNGIELHPVVGIRLG